MESAGWTKVTDLSNVSNYFYVFVDAGASETFMVRGANAVDRPRYTTLADPQENPDGVWVLEANGSNYAIKGIKDGYYFSSGSAGWNDYLAAANTNADFTFTLNSGKYDLTSVTTSKYVGPWGTTDASSSVNLSNGYENVAANKTSSLGFYIYAMPRGTYLAKASSTNPITVTGILNHPTLSDATPTGWTITRDGGSTPAYDKNLFEVFNANSFTLQQTATVPSGEYTIGVNGFYRAGTGGATTSTQNLYLFGNTSEAAVASINSAAYETQPSVDKATWSNPTNVGYVPNNMVAADYAIHTDSKYSNSLAGVTVTDGSLNLGLKRTEHIDNDWSIFNNFSLACTKLYIDGAALAYTDGASLAADTWYVYNVLSAGDYTLSATDGIVYTQNGSQGVNDDITSTAASSTITLAVGKLYIKSSAAQALTITPANYIYTAGTATADVAYIQPGNTVTVTYTGFETNNTSATLKKDFSGVTFGGETITVTATDNGFTFTVPTTVTANTTYTLSIPANAIGYEAGNTYNAAQEITLKTPALFNGTYFFRVANEVTGAQGKYLSRGTSWGTHATIDAYGLPIQVTTSSANVTTLSPRDTRRYYYHSNSYDLWADGDGASDASNFTITLTDGNYYIHSNSAADGTNFKFNDSDAGNEEAGVYDNGTSSNATVILWAVETATEHATKMQALKDAQAAAVVTAATASSDYSALSGITTVSGLENAVASYVKGDFVAASDISSVKEKYEGSQPNPAPETVYSNTIDITEPGLYKFSMKAFYRSTFNETTQAMHTDGVDFPPVVLFFGDSQTQIKSLYDENGGSTAYVSGNDAQYNSMYYANNTTAALAMFKEGKYDNDVWLYISKAGTYTYGVKYMGWASWSTGSNKHGDSGQWFIYSPESVTITSYAPAATSDDYTALTNAIAAAEGTHTLGFEKGEYAPYNNVDGISGTTMAQAKAIDKTATNSKLLVNSLTNTLNNLWTANTEDVAIIYNGNFATVEDGANYPKGWTRTNEWGQMRTDADKNSTSNGTAYYNQPGSLIYGSRTGYTMPLKANTVYKLTFKYASQENNTNTSMSASVLNSDNEGLASTSFGANGTKFTVQNAFKTATAFFSTGAAGDYVLTLTNGGNTVMTDVSLVEVEVASVTISDAKFATYVTESPVDFSKSTEVTAYTAAYANNVITLTPITGAVPENTPVVLHSETAGTYSLTPAGTGTAPEGNALKYFETATKATGTQWCLTAQGSSVGFAPVATTVQIPARKAYLEIAAGSTTAKFLAIDGTTTGVNAINAAVDNNAPRYNLAGQRVGKNYKGVVIVNGKKLVVK